MERSEIVFQSAYAVLPLLNREHDGTQFFRERTMVHRSTSNRTGLLRSRVTGTGILIPGWRTQGCRAIVIDMRRETAEKPCLFAPVR